MFQYAYGLAKSRITKRELLLDRSLFDLPSVPERFRLDAFSMSLCFTGKARNILHRAMLSGRLPEALRRVIAAASGTVVRDDASPEADPSGRITLYTGYFQRPAVFEGLLDDLRRDFSVPITSSRGKALEREIKSKNSVAVHVRRGDYAEVPLFRHELGVLGAAYFRSAIRFLRETHPEASFFVFTNDRRWAQQAIIGDTEAIKIVDLGPDGTDLEEMALMQACRHFIVANSTFSWWPAFLGQAPDKTVAAPQPWFRRTEDIGGMARPGWRLIAADWEAP